MLTVLKRVVPAVPGRPDLAGPDHPMRAITREIAAGGGWDHERAAKVAALFDRLAPEWHERGSPERLEPLTDAVARGGVAPGGRCVEVGSGTGTATPALAVLFAAVACVDLSREMLERAPARPGARVRGDAAQLPVRSRSVDAVVLVNAFLFPVEVDRVLAPDGVVIWVSTLGDRTPIYLPAIEVLDALPGTWSGVTAQAGWGEWLVARRASREPSDSPSG